MVNYNRKKEVYKNVWWLIFAFQLTTAAPYIMTMINVNSRCQLKNEPSKTTNMRNTLLAMFHYIWPSPVIVAQCHFTLLPICQHHSHSFKPHYPSRMLPHSPKCYHIFDPLPRYNENQIKLLQPPITYSPGILLNDVKRKCLIIFYFFFFYFRFDQIETVFIYYRFLNYLSINIYFFFARLSSLYILVYVYTNVVYLH